MIRRSDKMSAPPSLISFYSFSTIATSTITISTLEAITYSSRRNFFTFFFLSRILFRPRSHPHSRPRTSLYSLSFSLSYSTLLQFYFFVRSFISFFCVFVIIILPSFTILCTFYSILLYLCCNTTSTSPPLLQTTVRRHYHPYATQPYALCSALSGFSFFFALPMPCVIVAYDDYVAGVVFCFWGAPHSTPVSHFSIFIFCSYS